MCGRYSIALGVGDITRQIGKPLGVQIPDTAGAAAYNIAPTEQVLAIVSTDGTPQARMLRWGLVPEWATEITSPPHFNAKLERVEKSGKFLGVPVEAGHRALIPASEFDEWVKGEATRKVKPAPFGFTVDGGQAFCFAALWVLNKHVKDGPLASCTILTCDSASNSVVSPIHNRMPVILPDPQAWRAWIDPRVSRKEALSMCGPLTAERMSARALPLAFNNSRNKTPELLFDRPTNESEQQLSLT